MWTLRNAAESATAPSAPSETYFIAELPRFVVDNHGYVATGLKSGRKLCCLGGWTVWFARAFVGTARRLRPRAISRLGEEIEGP
jgi:hypothetical protein